MKDKQIKRNAKRLPKHIHGVRAEAARRAAQ